MPDRWPVSQLGALAHIRISNVDKKIMPGEEPIRLCNYMDAYSNEYISDDIPFMDGTASEQEIKNFRIAKGDILITKDSETPEDIGIPAVVIEDIDNLVCGYHLAIIRPDIDLIDSVYLAKQLASPRTARYFALNANGSTRYGLTISVIENATVPTPSKAEQAKIAEILSTVDQAIEQTEALIAKRQRIKTGLMQDLLTRGIDEHGNLRSEQTHEFKDSPLGRIPVEWEVADLDSWLLKKQYGISSSLSDVPVGVPVLRMNNLVEGEVDYSDLKYSDNKDAKAVLLDDCDVLFNRTNSIDNVGRTGIFRHSDQDVSFASYLVRLVPDSSQLHPEYLNLWLNDATNQIRVKRLATIGVQQANVNPTNLGSLLVAIPDNTKEQERIVKLVMQSAKALHDVRESLQKLRSIKTGLMQDLLTGKVRVTALLD